jgi:hypothetical protein
MKQLFVLLTANLLLGTSFLLAQKKVKPIFVVTPEINLLNGDEHISSNITLKAGVLKGKTQYSIGVGIDYYGYRTVPLVVDVKQFLGNKKNKAFVYAGAGYNITWLLNEQKTQNWLWGMPATTADYSNGFTYHYGIGYGFLNIKNKGLLVTIGINSKSLRETYDTWIFNGTTSVLMPTKNTYTLNRLAIGLAYSF